MRFLLTLIIVIYGTTIFAGDAEGVSSHRFNKKGEFYFYWGWNRAWYTTSDIQFTGTGYDFTLKNVVAYDRPSPFDAEIYFNPAQLTIPQYNLRFGYYFKNNLSISIGTDHMKYVMRNGQQVKINGFIENSSSAYNGMYDNEDITLSKDFLIFEHTDGLNYANSEIRHHDRLYHSSQLEINAVEGFGVGILYPRSNVTLLDFERNDQFHLAGYGIDVVAALNITFLKHFFVQPELKGGFINMPDIKTTKYSADKAKQHFYFTQFNVVFGVSLPLKLSKIKTDK